MLPLLEKASQTLARASRVFLAQLELLENQQAVLDPATEEVAPRVVVTTALDTVEQLIPEDDGEAETAPATTSPGYATTASSSASPTTTATPAPLRASSSRSSTPKSTTGGPHTAARYPKPAPRSTRTTRRAPNHRPGSRPAPGPRPAAHGSLTRHPGAGVFLIPVAR